MRYLLAFLLGFFALQAAAQADTSIYQMVEEDAQFDGGLPAYAQYVSENAEVPDALAGEAVKATIVMGFVVEKDGSISNVEVKRGLGNAWDEEAVRLIASMPKWIPGKQGGDIKRVQKYLPVKVNYEPMTEEEYHLSQITQQAHFIVEKQVDLYTYMWNHLPINFDLYDHDHFGKLGAKILVSKTGTIDSVVMYQSMDEVMDTSFERVLYEMPKWAPTLYQDQPINSWTNVEIGIVMHGKEVSIGPLSIATNTFEAGKMIHPKYPIDGLWGMYRYIFQNMKYPQEAMEKNLEGTLKISFLVNEIGHLHEYEILDSVGGGCEEEAIRIFESMLPWIPGKLDGEDAPIRVTHVVPFNRNSSGLEVLMTRGVNALLYGE